MPEITFSQWETFTRNLSGVHLLQTGEWGHLKEDFGWQARYILSGGEPGTQLGAVVLFRRLFYDMNIAYIPKGPVRWSPERDSDWGGWDNFVKDLDRLCRSMKSIFLIFEPDLWSNQLGGPPPGFVDCSQSIQPPRTIIVDISGGEEAILGRMKQKTRYNIRLAAKRGVVVEPSKEVEAFYNLMNITGERDAFGIHSLDYYKKAYQIFHPLDECELLVASYQEEPLASIMVFRRDSRSWYFYGASSNDHRELMASYLVQWEAIRWAIKHGCTSYDLWGVPDEPETKLEADFTGRSDGLWGVYRFKRGFGGTIYRSAGPFQRIYKPAMFNLYQTAYKIRNISLR
jgi:peptidoglycan pentaglycine glycine transferase (the first glycine)